ncbi:MAG: LptF/LptG family permease [Alphaproteobacteria bacterium]|nr:LptF/LptG family permease [Alphaproteobacteria bacterium]
MLSKTRIIDLYILRKTLVPLLMTVSIALFALLLERLIRLLDMVANQSGSLQIIFKMLASLIPHYLGIALPAAFFVGTILTVMKLCQDNELDAFQSMGYGIHRLLVPLGGLALSLLLIIFLVIGFMQPHTRYVYRALVYAITHTALNAVLQRESFFTGLGGMTIFIDDINTQGQLLTGIYIHEQKNNEEFITTTAHHGEIFRSKDDNQLILSLNQASRIESNQKTGQTNLSSFDRLDIPLDIAFDQEKFRNRGLGGERELTLFELLSHDENLLKNIPPQNVQAEIHSRLVRVFSLLFLPIMAIPLGISNRRIKRGLGLVAGLVLLVTYHHLLQFGENLVETNSLSPWIALWFPFLLYSFASCFALYLTVTKPGFNLLDSLDNISHTVIQPIKEKIYKNLFISKIK